MEHKKDLMTGGLLSDDDIKDILGTTDDADNFHYPIIEGKRSWEEELWLKVWLIVAGSSNCTNADSPSIWADRCVRDFKEKYRKFGE